VTAVTWATPAQACALTFFDGSENRRHPTWPHAGCAGKVSISRTEAETDSAPETVVEVIQDFATEQEIEPGERRVHDHIVLGEQHHVAYARVDQVAVTLSAEKTRQARR
jgi:hypothetical protein